MWHEEREGQEKGCEMRMLPFGIVFEPRCFGPLLFKYLKYCSLLEVAVGVTDSAGGGDVTGVTSFFLGLALLV